MSAHDRWLANYHTETVHVWCEKPGCDNHVDGVDVRFESEYGQGSLTPEECWICHSSWLQEQPQPKEEEDE